MMMGVIFQLLKDRTLQIDGASSGHLNLYVHTIHGTAFGNYNNHEIYVGVGRGRIQLMEREL